MSAAARMTWSPWAAVAAEAHAARCSYALAAIALGQTSAFYCAFALQYQPVPLRYANELLLAWCAALVLVSAGTALLHPRTSRAGALVLALWFLGWVLLLHVPRMLWQQLSLGAALPACSVAAAACGAALLAAGESRGGRRWAVAWLRLFACAQIVFGACHFIYFDITASMVPAGLPASEAWAALTGAAHLLAAAAMLLARHLRTAGAWLSAMYFGFAAFVCLPLLVSQPGRHLHWLMLEMTLLCAASAWLVRSRAHLLEGRTARTPSGPGT
jgi:hypothetical protein